MRAPRWVEDLAFRWPCGSWPLRLLDRVSPRYGYARGLPVPRITVLSEAESQRAQEILQRREIAP